MDSFGYKSKGEKLFKSQKLKDILTAELALGNEIIEDSSWPPKCDRLILLKRRFHQHYGTYSLSYNKLNDSHYWSEEYISGDGSECLACR